MDQSYWGVVSTEITNLVFADDAIIIAESLEILVMALEALQEKVKPLALRFPGPRPTRFRCLETYWIKQYTVCSWVWRRR